MKIKFKNLGFESDEPVWAVNLKAENVEAIKKINFSCLSHEQKILDYRAAYSRNRF